MFKMNDSAFAQSANETMPVDQKTTDLNCDNYYGKDNVKQANDRELAVEIGEHYQVKRSDSTWRTCSPHFIAHVKLKYEVYAVPHSSPEVSAQFPILCMYLMGSNWSSAYRSASRGKLLLLLLCIVRLQLGSRWVRVRVSCRVRFSVRVSFTVRVSVRVMQVAILSCKL